jgi:transcriptional regulator with XRE-family HTH domain
VDQTTPTVEAANVPAQSEAHAAVGEAIRAIRNESGISQEAFALKCGLDRSYFGAVERGERNVSLTNLLKITRSLGVSPSELFARAQTINAKALR